MPSKIDISMAFDWLRLFLTRKMGAFSTTTQPPTDLWYINDFERNTVDDWSLQVVRQRFQAMYNANQYCVGFFYIWKSYFACKDDRGCQQCRSHTAFFKVRALLQFLNMDVKYWKREKEGVSYNMCILIITNARAPNMNLPRWSKKSPNIEILYPNFDYLFSFIWQWHYLIPPSII